MALQSINPATGEVFATHPYHGAAEVEQALAAVAAASPAWRDTGFERRAEHLRALAAHLRATRDRYAVIMTREMGKPIREARAEVEKCAWVCDFYAEHASTFLADEEVATDASRSFVTCQPLGTVLAIMPWNFPFWQVLRFAAPALMAGNTCLLKHASNVPLSALAIEEAVRAAGLPEGVFRTLLVPAGAVEAVIADPRVHAVTLTGSEAAGRKVAAAAGAHLKKTVLELGGSDAFIVLEDADLDHAAQVGVTSRYLNSGQSCIAAKRFIVVESVADEFLEAFRARARALRLGDPMDEATELGPMARADLREELHRQVTDTLGAGARAAFGCQPVPGPGSYYAASALDGVLPGMRAWDEELFGPCAIVIRARDEADAVRIANGSRYGLGGSVWSADAARGERVARALASGAAFVNGLVKSDPRLPFGGVKASGYGRELSSHGIREFVNVKSVWMA